MKLYFEYHYPMFSAFIYCVFMIFDTNLLCICILVLKWSNGTERHENGQDLCVNEYFVPEVCYGLTRSLLLRRNKMSEINKFKT